MSSEDIHDAGIDEHGLDELTPEKVSKLIADLSTIDPADYAQEPKVSQTFFPLFLN